MVEVAGTYRAGRGAVAPERAGPPPLPRAREPQASVPDFIVEALSDIKTGLASTDKKVADLTLLVAERNATWKDKAVTQFGAIALAALGVIGGQYALRDKPTPAATILYKSELQTRAEGCAAMANGSDTEYQRCMIRDVVAPNTPSVQAYKSR